LHARFPSTGASFTGYSTGAFAGILDLERNYLLVSHAAECLHSARCGYARALTLCSDSGDSRLDDSPAALAQRDAVRTAIEQLNLYTDAVFVGQKVRVRGLLNAEEHNGRTGTCLRRLKPRSPEEVQQPRYAKSTRKSAVVLLGVEQAAPLCSSAQACAGHVPAPARAEVSGRGSAAPLRRAPAPRQRQAVARGCGERAQPRSRLVT
jgi:hypothetical protein